VYFKIHKLRSTVIVIVILYGSYVGKRDEVLPVPPLRHTGGAKIELLGNRARFVVNVTPLPLYGRQRTPVPTEQEVGWAIWRTGKSLSPAVNGSRVVQPVP
jgi:hypothetical protein